MKKSERMRACVSNLAAPEAGIDPCYAGYFACFNAGEYYEAHDVLEHLWLQCTDENRLFYQGLIQIAGGFVHLQKQFLHPAHPKHGLRMRPAARLLRLGVANIQPYGPEHLLLNVRELCSFCEGLAAGLDASGFEVNPWRPESAPQLRLLGLK